ncbi:Putative Holin-X, holin superfamily III [Faunimonas pinastri]|uniref:Putative Holin-X, holin superfamily III n=1 Tax=Faunimonas pinastri TaxID=1855383 RepID=A0A1H8ZAH7_9HYPH|nr:phage holin family protein [Faunimonas pinastri]SEP61440.1 Putative Holin-X, holin superfamily III [Faunimonas pinastri]
MFNLLRTVGLAYAVANLKERLKTLAIKGVLAVVALIVLLYALLFLLVCAFAALSHWVGPIGAAAIVAAVLIVIAVILVVVAMKMGASPGGSSSKTQAAAAMPTDQILNAARSGYERINNVARRSRSRAPWKNPIYQLAGAALLTGVIVGRRRK